MGTDGVGNRHNPRQGVDHQQFVVHKDTKQKYPHAETPTHHISMGFHHELYPVTKIAVREMVDYLMSEKHLSHDEAYMLTSVAGDVSITQLVDGNVGVDVMMPKSIFITH